MTVCIAAVCEPTVGDEHIIVASDRMVSMGGYVSGDDVVRKIDPVAHGWTSMLAGNDVSPAVPILARMKEHRKTRKCDESLALMSSAMKSAYRDERLEIIEDEILSPLGFSWDTFRRNGKNQLPERAYERVIDQIGAYEVDVTFLVSGFDSIGSAHIFTVSNPGKCDYYDKVGFWAIGSGQHQAISSLFATKYERFSDLEECVSAVLVAKLTSESASGVGKNTWLMVESAKARSKSIHIYREALDSFREAWYKLPKLPDKGIAAILKNLNEEKKRIAENKEVSESDSQTSGSGP